MNYELSPYSPPFRTKKNVVITLYRSGFRKFVRKTVTVEKKFRMVFQELLQPIKDHYARDKKLKLSSKQQNISFEQQQRQNILIYQMSVPHINSKTLKQYLLNQQLTLSPSIQLIQSLINSYLNHIPLNYTIRTLGNIFITKNWNNNTIFIHNSTSIAFLLDIYTESSINRCDFMQYINYLPTMPIQKYPSSSYVLQIRSLAINMLSIILQREITFYIHSFEGQLFINRKQLLREIRQNKNNLDKFLSCEKIKEKIRGFSIQYNIDFLNFFKAILLEQNQSSQFDSWSKILNYFHIKDLSKLAQQIDCLSNKRDKQTHIYSIFDIIEQKWKKESPNFKNKFNDSGIIKDITRENLLLYLIQKYKLSNQAKFSFQQNNSVYFPSLTKVILQILNQQLQMQKQNNNFDKISYLFSAIQHISKQLHQITLKEPYSSSNYFTLCQGINLQQFLNITNKI